MLGNNLQKSIKISFQNIIESKKLFIFLVVIFIVLGFFLITKNGGVKGTISKNYTFIVYDDNNRLLIKSNSTEAEKILTENNIKVWPEDIVEKELVLDPVVDSGAGEKIIIHRAPVFTILVDGEEKTVRSWEGTIEGVLTGKVTLGPRDIVEPAISSKAIPGEITITRINIVEAEENLPIAFITTYQDDYFTPKGQEKVMQAGQNGTKKRQLKITYKNGAEVSRIITGESVVAGPINKIVKRGLMPSNDRDFKRVYWDIMVVAGQKYRISPLDLFEVASCESHVNPNSAGLYYGMFQYNLDFWKKASGEAGYGGALWSDANAQINTTAYWASKYGWGRWGCKP